MDVEPLYFGRHDHLFGVFHPGAGGRDRGIVICPPLLNEYMRSHYALRQVAQCLSRRGYDVLRFDFSGQGNSLLDTESVSVATWQDDIADAIAEVRSLSGVHDVAIVSVRFASCLAARAAIEAQVERFVCWDPIFVGSEWASVLRDMHRDLRAAHAAGDLIGDSEFMGHRMSDRFLADVESVACRPAELPHLSSVFSEQAFEQRAQHYGDSMLVPFDCGWTDLTSHVLYAHDIVDRLAARFE